MYYHSWILFISQLNSKEATPLSKHRSPSRLEEGKEILTSQHHPSPRLDLQEPLCYAGDLQPKCFQVLTEGPGNSLPHPVKPHVELRSWAVGGVLKAYPRTHITSTEQSLSGSWC